VELHRPAFPSAAIAKLSLICCQHDYSTAGPFGLELYVPALPQQGTIRHINESKGATVQRILITGANRGLGLGFTIAYLAAGHHVIAGCRHPDQASALQALTTTYPQTLTIVQLDVADQASIDASYHQVSAVADGLDILLNNAGIPFGTGKWESSEQLGSLTFEGLLDIFRVNAAGNLMTTQRYLDLVRRGTNAKIVSISSWFGTIGGKDANFVNNFGYSASKVAINLFMKHLAILLENEHILTAALDPGWVRTDMGGPQGFLSVEQAVDDLVRVIDNLTPETSGRFLNWEGKVNPW